MFFSFLSFISFLLPLLFLLSSISTSFFSHSLPPLHPIVRLLSDKKGVGGGGGIPMVHPNPSSYHHSNPYRMSFKTRRISDRDASKILSRSLERKRSCQRTALFFFFSHIFSLSPSCSPLPPLNNIYPGSKRFSDRCRNARDSLICGRVCLFPQRR